jgi:hypothetical protein
VIFAIYVPKSKATGTDRPTFRRAFGSNFQSRKGVGAAKIIFVPRLPCFSLETFLGNTESKELCSILGRFSLKTLSLIYLGQRQTFLSLTTLFPPLPVSPTTFASVVDDILSSVRFRFGLPVFPHFTSLCALIELSPVPIFFKGNYLKSSFFE